MSGVNDVQATLREMWETRPARPRDDRKIAGVASAIARRYDIDPTLVRIGFVVAAFYGIGFLLYLAGWILLPDSADASDPDRKRRSEPHPILLIVLVLAAIGTATGVFFGNRGSLVGLAVVAGLLYLLHRSRGDRGTAAAGPVGGPYGAGTDAPTVQAATASPAAGAAGPAAAGAAGSGAAGPEASPAGEPTERPADPPAWDPLGAAPFAWDLPDPSPPPEPPPPPRPGSLLVPVTLGLVLLAGGIAGAAVLSFGDLAGLRIVFGAVLAVLGLGLVVGAFLRRGRSLILLAVPMIVLTYALTAASSDGSFQAWRGAGEVIATPLTVAAVEPAYQLSVGDLQLDLRELDLSAPAGADTSAVATTVAVDAGNIQVDVPPDADVTVHCHAGMGHIDCLGQDQGGPGVDATVTDLGRDGIRSGRPLVLDVSAGLGNVEVHRG